MPITMLRRVTSTRYIFLLSGVAFVLWSLAGSVVPLRSSALSTLLWRMDFDQRMTQLSIHAENSSFLNDLFNLDSLKFESLRPHVGIGVARAHIYVVSLADRQDRREEMELLRKIQGLTWTIVDAVPGNATLVNRILDWVAIQRAGESLENDSRNDDHKGNNNTSQFRWPEDINALAVSNEPLGWSGADRWAETSAPTPTPTPSDEKSKSDSDSLMTTSRSSLACATEDDTMRTFVNGTPAWMELSPAKIACWHSHILAIRRFVERRRRHHQHVDQDDDVAIILEDDVDMEKDVSIRLAPVWGSLPSGWDIVFLGHCWSDESRYPPLTQFATTNVHPSYHPKCTHAYAVSHTGARRLLQHLRYPPFAYSRALDQAYAWLVRSGRLRSYSIVPSVVVQRKSGHSDILPGSGSEWKESLQDGVF